MKNLKTKLNQVRQSDGFTIIEVMIVLAIAGVIMLIVLLTVPSLQRNSRNTQRKSDATHLASLVNEYAANNSGALPTGLCNTTAGCTSGYADATNEKFGILTIPYSSGQYNLLASTAIPAVSSMTKDQAYIISGTTCSGNTPSSTNATARNFTVYYLGESSGGTTAICVGS